MRYFRRFLVVIVAFAIISIALLTLYSGSYMALFQAPPVPNLPGAKPMTSCSLPGVPAQRTAAPNANTTAGVFYLNTFTLPQGIKITLTGNLTIITDQLLQIDGTITHGPRALARNISITLYSRQGAVIVGATGQVGEANVPLQQPNPIRSNLKNALAAGLAGRHGGTVTLLAPQGTISVLGNVDGFGASSGGAAVASGTPLQVFFGRFGGGAIAVGGKSGAGGDVRLCALDGIVIPGKVRGGWSGDGGSATAVAQNGQDAYAQGGPANRGGDVYINGLVPAMAVFVPGSITGGAGLPGGDANVTGGNGGIVGGGNADAIGGAGTSGGTVFFNSCVVNPPFGPINAHAGGNGGDATSRGGTGPGRSGGNADSKAGNGGPDGALPAIPVPVGAVAQGGLSRGGVASGTGGTATAKGGTGGAGVWGANGGSSGTSTAKGGRGAVTGVPAPVPPAPATPPVGATGGVGVTVTAPGAP